MTPFGMFANNILIAALSAWFIAQSAKVPIHYLKNGEDVPGARLVTEKTHLRIR